MSIACGLKLRSNAPSAKSVHIQVLKEIAKSQTCLRTSYKGACDSEVVSHLRLKLIHTFFKPLDWWLPSFPAKAPCAPLGSSQTGNSSRARGSSCPGAGLRTRTCGIVAGSRPGARRSGLVSVIRRVISRFANEGVR